MSIQERSTITIDLNGLNCVIQALQIANGEQLQRASAYALGILETCKAFGERHEVPDAPTFDE